MPHSEKVIPGWEDKVITYLTRDRLVVGEAYRVLRHNYMGSNTTGKYIGIYGGRPGFMLEGESTDLGMYSTWGITEVMLLSDYEAMMGSSPAQEVPPAEGPVCRCSSPIKTRVFISQKVGWVEVCSRCKNEIGAK